MGKYYAGIGSRKTPDHVLHLMEGAARALGEAGWVLRSGGAIGADTAFEEGAAFQPKEIFTADGVIPQDAFGMAADVHPAWEACSPYARRLHARNCMQILGEDLMTPVAFVLCWTPDGASSASETSRVTGGTGQAIRLASVHHIPVFNLANTEVWNRVALYASDLG